MVKRIDFHIHTISSKKDYEFEFSLEWLRDYVSKAKLDAIAITNHDLFDKENYLEIKRSLEKLNCKVYPGMELSLEAGHVNIVFDTTETENLSSFSSWIERNKSDPNSIISVAEFTENMENWSDGIYIFELGKSNSLNVPEELNNIIAVGGVSNQLKFQSILLKDDELAPVLFSDAHATEKDSDNQRNDIDSLKQKNTFLQIDNCSFEEIKNCISDKRKTAVNSDLLSDVFEINSHRVSTGLNLIVGKRGTGKTYFLEKIKKEYPTDEVYEIAQFETSNSEEFIEKHRKSQGLKAFENWKNKYLTQFEAIKKYLNSSDDNLMKNIENYLDSLKVFAKDTANSKSSSKYKLTKEATFEVVPIDSLTKYLESLQEIIVDDEFWGYLSEPEQKKEIFIESYKELRTAYIKNAQEADLKERVNEIIEDVKSISRSRTGISKVEDFNFSHAMIKVKTEEAINSFLEEIIKEEVIKSETLHGYKIVVKASPYDGAQQFRKFHSINEAVDEELIIPYKDKDYITFLNNLKQKNFYNSSNLEEYFMHLEVDLLDSYGTPASGGQAVGFALILRLEEAKEKPLILIDEPEASLDNDYLKNELINAIKNLKNYSTVFVITHNSTLGTLLEPDYLIVTQKNSNNDYQVLTGAYSSKIISNNSEKLDSYDLFVEAMEAGIETYKEKGVVYDFFKS